MSTYWYFECLSHSPALPSQDEFTQHTNDSAYWAAIEMASRRPLAADSLPGEYFGDQAYRFLVQHPSCELGLVNEYGIHEPLPKIVDPDLCECGHHRLSGSYGMSHDDWNAFNQWVAEGKPKRRSAGDHS